MCKICELTKEDLENMTINMVFKYIDEYLDIKNPETAKNKVIQYADEAPSYV